MKRASHHIFKAILLKKMYYPDYFLIGPTDDHKYNIEKSNRKMRLPYTCLFEPCVPVFLRVFLELGEIYSKIELHLSYRTNYESYQNVSCANYAFPDSA